jgi:chromosome segregation ATPase
MTPEMPDAAETAKFLRRFADLMSNGQNAIYLQNAAVLLETLTARLTAALEEDELWRYKHETAIQQADAFEAECDALKHDIEGHVNITSAILSERDALKSALQVQEEEISGLHDSWDRERGELATKLDAQDKAKAEIRVACDRERESFRSTLEARGNELDRLRSDLEREREDFSAKSKAHLSELSELRLAFDQERAQLQGQQKLLGDKLATSRFEHDALKMKIADLEKKRTESRSPLNQSGDRRDQTVEHGNTGHSIAAEPGLDAGLSSLLAQRIDPDSASEETNAVVPKTTLRQVRAQFEYLAKEFIALGDIASQVMCELGVNTMDLALNADRID